MGATRTAAGADGTEAHATFEAEGCSPPRSWSNGPGDTYGRHDHPRHKVLFCLTGSIVFHTDDGDVELAAGDRLDLEPSTNHAATVGASGCTCIEAWR
jgi:mannose-6-phosphate isomerase-like protein (cupin superfamily)